MNITVEEADKRICPRTIGVAPVYDQGIGLRDGGPWSCVGPRCMAWRWQATCERISAFGVGGTTEPAGKTIVSETHGHCGLAGAAS